MPGGNGWPLRPRGRAVVGRVRANRSVSIETTAGPAGSATASNDDSRSAAGAISAAVGLFAEPTRPCAQPKRVRSKPDAKMSPHMNATTIAAPNFARVYFVVIGKRTYSY